MCAVCKYELTVHARRGEQWVREALLCCPGEPNLKLSRVVAEPEEGRPKHICLVVEPVTLVKQFVAARGNLQESAWLDLFQTSGVLQN